MELQMLWLCSGRLTLADNVLGLYVVGDFTHKSSIEVQKFNKSTKV
jgi:hypothetical protein